MYYLNSRYYDPSIGRFINADSIGLLGANRDFESFNLYAYCGNNPVLRADVGGGVWELVAKAVTKIAVGALKGLAGQFVSDCVTSAMNGEWTFSSISTYVGAAVGGAVSEVIPVPYLSEAAGSAASTAVEMLIDNITGNGEPVGFEEFVYETTTSAAVGALLGGPFNADLKQYDIDILADIGQKLGPTVSYIGKKIPTKCKKFVREAIVTLITSPISAIGTVMVEALPGTHIWD